MTSAATATIPAMTMWGAWGVDFGHLSLTPTEYVERQCFVSIDTDEEPGMFAIDGLSVPHVVWGSDYPHHDSKFPNAIKTLASLPGMDEAKLRNVLNDAPVALYGSRVAAHSSEQAGAV